MTVWPSAIFLTILVQSVQALGTYLMFLKLSDKPKREVKKNKFQKTLPKILIEYLTLEKKKYIIINCCWPFWGITSRKKLFILYWCCSGEVLIVFTITISTEFLETGTPFIFVCCCNASKNLILIQWGNKFKVLRGCVDWNNITFIDPRSHPPGVQAGLTASTASTPTKAALPSGLLAKVHNKTSSSLWQPKRMQFIINTNTWLTKYFKWASHSSLFVVL